MYVDDKNGHIHMVQNKADTLQAINMVQSALEPISTAGLALNVKDFISAAGLKLSGKVTFLAALDSTPLGLAVTFSATVYGNALENFEYYVQSQPDTWVMDVDLVAGHEDELEAVNQAYQDWINGSGEDFEGPD